MAGDGLPGPTAKRERKVKQGTGETEWGWGKRGPHQRPYPSVQQHRQAESRGQASCSNPRPQLPELNSVEPSEASVKVLQPLQEPLTSLGQTTQRQITRAGQPAGEGQGLAKSPAEEQPLRGVTETRQGSGTELGDGPDSPCGPGPAPPALRKSVPLAV